MLHLLGKTAAKESASYWYTKPFLLMRGWGLGTRLDHIVVSKRSVTWELGLTQLYTDVLKHKQPVNLLKGTRSVTHCTGHVSANARMCWGD